MKRFLIILVLIIAVVALLFISNPATNTDSGDKIKVAVSIRPLADLVKQVGGEYVETITVLPDGSSPHTYEPMASDLAKLNNTKIAFMIGQNLDDWALTMLQSGISTEYKTIDLSQDIDLLISDHEHDEDEEEHEEEEEHDEDENYDPHYWLSYTNAKIMVNRIAEELASIDAGNKDYYLANATTYNKELDKARTAAVAKLANLPTNGIITFHNAYQYFANDLGLEIVATVHPFPGNEPTAQYLAEVGEVINTYNIKTLFREPELSDAVVAALAADYGAKIETLNPLGVANSSFIEMMTYNVDTITKALSN